MYVGWVVFDLGHNNFLSQYLVFYVAALCSESHKKLCPFPELLQFSPFLPLSYLFYFLVFFQISPTLNFLVFTRSSSHIPIWELDHKECWIDAFRLWCWRRLLRVLRKARRSNQLILKEINPEYSLGGLMLKLRLQYFGCLTWKADSLEDPDVGKDWSQKEKRVAEDEKVKEHHGLSEHESEQTLGDNEGQGSLMCTVHGVAKVVHDLVNAQ